MHERVDHLERESVGVRRQSLRRDDAHELPVAGHRVLALGALGEPPGHGRCARLRRAPLELLDVAEPERLEIREIEPSHRPRDVAQGVRPLVAETVGVGQRARPDAVQHDDACP